MNKQVTDVEKCKKVGKSKTITFRLTQNQHFRITTEACRVGCTLSELLRLFVQKGVVDRWDVQGGTDANLGYDN